MPFLLIGINTTLQHQTKLLPINSLFTTTTLPTYNIQSFKMKLNFLLAAAFVAAPVLAASTTTTTQYGHRFSIQDLHTNKRQHIHCYCQGFLKDFQGRRCPYYGR